MKIKNITRHKDSFRRIFITNLIIMSFSILAAGQNSKREFERYISKNEFPPLILNDLQPILSESKKTKYIEEYDSTLHSYEIKTLWNERQLSIEFFEDGSIMDIEEMFRLKDAEEKVKRGIESFLSNSFRKYKIIRSQRQYSSNTPGESNETIIRNFKKGRMERFQKRFEIVARVISHDKKTIGTFEFLFSEECELIRWRRVEKMLTDNVLF